MQVPVHRDVLLIRKLCMLQKMYDIVKRKGGHKLNLDGEASVILCHFMELPDDTRKLIFSFVCEQQ